MKKQFPVLEMSCAACATSVESLLSNTPGIEQASVNYANHSASITWDNSIITPIDIQNALRGIGYDIIIEEENAQEIQEASQLNYYKEIKSRTIWSAIFSVPVVILGMFFMDIPYGNWISMVLSTPVVFYFGRHFFVSAWKKIKHGSFNMDTLVALSVGTAYAFSLFNTIFPEFWHARGIHPHVYYESAVVIIVFISFGKFLEEGAKSNTSSALKKLMGMQAKTVKVKRGDEEIEIEISALLVGDIVLVKPGEKIAVDGVVVEGESYVDESLISGEPLAVLKTIDTKVFAGTLNQKGSFSFRAEKVGADTLLSQIIKRVQEAQGSKAPVQKYVDKVASIFVPTVIGISILTFIVWMIFGGENAFTYALLNAVTVLVIACPCALGLATPTAIMVGVGKAAEKHMLIRDAESLENASRVDTIVLDKTGTITMGKPVLSDILWDDALKSIDDEAILYSMEEQSEHPLSDAILHYLEKTQKSIGIRLFSSITGKGIQATYENKCYFVGSLSFLKEMGAEISEPLQQSVNEWLGQSKSVMAFGTNKHVLSVIATEDPIKENSIYAIETLQNNNIKVYILSGDHQRSVDALADKVNVTDAFGGLMPSDKSEWIRKLQKQGRNVAMVGDGINDTEALALADLSIAMAHGSDIAMDVAKVTVINSDLRAVSEIILLSKKVVRIIKQNLFWAFIYNIIGIPIAAGVLFPINGFLLNPMIAGAAMALSSVSVVLNSLRLKN
jgi:Cu2+-exporting ATPase